MSLDENAVQHAFSIEIKVPSKCNKCMEDISMAKAGRPKKEDPVSHHVSVKFNNAEYELMVDYAKRHDMTVSRMLRYGIEKY